MTHTLDMTGSNLTALRNLRIVDFGTGMCASLVAKQLLDFGATLFRIVPQGGDPFDTVYPAHRLWRQGEQSISAAQAMDMLADADVCIIGGEDFPGLPPMPDAEDLHRRYPRLIILRLTGDGPHSDTPAVDLLVQAQSGIVYEQFSDRPIVSTFPMPSYGAALLGLIGLLIGLVERERTPAQNAQGQIVDVSLSAGAAVFWGPFWMNASKADAGFEGITPRDVRQLILPCADGRYVQITMGVPGAVAKVHQVLGIPGPVDPEDRGMPDHERGPERFYGDVALFSTYAQRQPRDALMRAFHAAGVPSEAVLEPGACWDDEQVKLNRIIATDDAGWQKVGNPMTLELTDQPPSPVPARLRAHNPDAPPLAGIRIMDCGMFVAGPYAAKLLGDYGADVIRVEPPSGRTTLSGERTIIAANHGKRAICVDAKSPAGHDVVEKLCATADIVLHNFRPGVAERLGMGQQRIREIQPGIVTLETTAYGPIGPKAQAPGFDMVMQASCGLQHRAGGEGNTPMCSRSPVVDFATGAVGAIALLAGLYERLNTGRAIKAETSLLNVGLWMLSELIRDPQGHFHGAPPINATQTGFHPAESLYQTRDGWIAIAARSNDMAADLARLLGVAAPADRAAWDEATRTAIAAAIAAHNNADALRRLKETNIWAAPCIRDAWAQRPVDGLILREMEDAEYGRVTHCIGALIQFSRSRNLPATRLSTAPGADSRVILEEIGISTDQIDAWFAQGVVR